jgi:hypothetical protein
LGGFPRGPERALEVLAALVSRVTDARLVTLMAHPGELLLSAGVLFAAPAGFRGEPAAAAAPRRDAAKNCIKALLHCTPLVRLHHPSWILRALLKPLLDFKDPIETPIEF